MDVDALDLDVLLAGHPPKAEKEEEPSSSAAVKREAKVEVKNEVVSSQELDVYKGGELAEVEEVEVPEEVWPRIDNVIASVNLGLPVDLKTIAFKGIYHQLRKKLPIWKQIVKEITI